jgi:hypothetical protein
MDPGAALREQFVALLGGAHVDAPGSLLGVEQEFTVRTSTAWPADFRELYPALSVNGAALDPADPNARRCRSGVVVTVDGREAEVATPPVPVRPGFAHETEAWARAARDELVGLLPDAYAVSGYSSHLSVSIDDARNTRVGALYARTFAPGLMLLVDRATSPGLIVRPRPGRTELCGEFVDGPLLRAAAVYAVGSVLACRDAIVGVRALAELPPQLEVAVQPALARAGWYVDRHAFGPDMLTAGRSARLRRCDGRRIHAQDHLEVAWDVARDALGARVERADLGTLDELVSGTRALPCESPPVDDETVGPTPAPSVLGDVHALRVRPAFTVQAVASTWKLTVFGIRSRTRERDAYAAIPRAHLPCFFARLESGALDDVVTRYLALDDTARPVATTGSEPSIGDTRPSDAAITDHERDAQLAATVPASRARSGKYRGIVVETPYTTAERRGCLPPIGKWIAGIGIAALVAGGIAYAVASGGGDEEKQAGPAPAPGPNGPVCGARTTGAQIDIDAILRSCGYSQAQLTGTDFPYMFDATPFKNATVNLPTPTTALVFGTARAVHNPTPQERAAASDPNDGFTGPSFVCVPSAGLRPSSLLEVALRAPDDRVHTGRGVADSSGYAEARVPIDMPAIHTIVSARYFPNGDPSGASVPIAPTAVAADGRIDAAFPGGRCDRDATLAMVAKPAPSSGDAEKLAHAAITDSASLFAALGAYALPAASIDLSGPWTVDQAGTAFGVHGAGLSFNLQPVASAGGDKRGDAPASVYYHGGATIGPGGAGSGAAWQREFPCGAGQLALTVCPTQSADLADAAYAAIAAVFDQPVPLSPATNASYAFTVGDQRYELAYDARRRERGAAAWSLQGPDAGARAHIRNNVVLLVVPRDASGGAGYRIQTTVGGKRDTQPPADQPAGQLQTTIAVALVPGTQPAETAEQFVPALGRALTNGDTAFIRARMHPAVIDRYGTATCDAYAAAAHAPVEFTVHSVDPPSVYKWETDGLSRNVPGTNNVNVTQVGGGVSAERVIHVALVDGLWRWFTDCGDPLPGAP